jgi:prepilin-type N-terminal cleavage/methylation domain-containing protein
MPFSRPKPNAAVGFTLLEVLLVVLIIAITAGIGAPYLVNSIRGNRLRAASRTIIMAGRYARSMAVLRQRDLALTFNIDAASVRVGDAATLPSAETDPSVPEADNGTFLEEEPSMEEKPTDEPTAGDEETPRQTNTVGAAGAGVSRSLDGIAIESVEMDGETLTQGVCVVPYAPSGTCAPYVVTLADGRGRRMIVSVDAVSTPQASLEGK